MQIPKARKLSSGSWFIQLRLGGESISVTDPDNKKCEREARYIKSEYLAGKRLKKTEKPPEPEKPIITLEQAIDDYCKFKSNVLSPATIRGYQNIRKNQLKRSCRKIFTIWPS